MARTLATPTNSQPDKSNKLSMKTPHILQYEDKTEALQKEH